MVLMQVHSLRSARSVVVAMCATVAGLAFMTVTADAASLPDGRVYEVVSPAATEGNANVYVPLAGFIYTTPFGDHGVYSSHPFEVAPDGESVVYAGNPPPTDGTGHFGVGSGDEYLATRSPGGWTQVDIQKPDNQCPGSSASATMEYEAFSSDLSEAILALPHGSSFQPLYSHATAGPVAGEYHPLMMETPHLRSIKEFKSVYAGGNTGTGGVPEFTHLLFEADDAVLEGEGNLERELRNDVKREVEEGKDGNYLYDSVGGQVSLVSVLPDGKVATGSFDEGLSRVISADGSRVFWTDS